MKKINYYEVLVWAFMVTIMLTITIPTKAQQIDSADDVMNVITGKDRAPFDLPADVSDEVYITDIIVENPGTGYENATIDDKCLTLNTVDGQITSIEISCQKPYTTLPDITSLIVNPRLGAVLRQIISSNPRVLDQAVLESVDCVGDFPEPGES